MFELYNDIFFFYVQGRYKRYRKDYRIKGITQHVRFFTYIPLKVIKDVLTKLKSLSGKRSKVQLPSGKKWVFCTTVNNYQALKFLLKRYDDGILVHYNGYSGLPDVNFNLAHYIQPNIALLKHLYVLYLYFHRYYTANYYTQICRSFHLYRAFKKALEQYKPACVFISNDHTPVSRSLILAAKNSNTPVFYFQHASVSRAFPPLRFTGSFLYGTYSQKIYEAIGNIQGELHVVGNHKYDGMQGAINDGTVISTIGIAYNSLDSPEKVKTLAMYIRERFPGKKVILRKHPDDVRELAIQPGTGIEFSDPLKENSLSYLQRIDCVIANNSSILLEGALLNVKPVQINFSDLPDRDYYEFVKYGVAKSLSDFSELENELNDAAGNYRINAKYFDASIQSPYEFNVEDEILQILKEQYLIQ